MPYRFLAFIVALLLAACGGGGGSSSGDSSGSAPLMLRGVAATGAPLVNAQVSVVDGQGKVVGSATTHAADGSYSITLATANPAAPLFIQVRGMDAGGNPQVLHSTVPSIGPAMVGHVTPLTNAVVALALGTEPAPVFAAAATSGSQLSQMAGAVPAASDFLKTLVKTQMTDLKIASLDLMADASFAANKGPHDLLIESVRVDLARSARNVPLLQVANKFLAAPTAEVVVELPTAQAELLKTSGATPANAITSTLKAATSATKLLANLPSVDELGAALNQLIAQGKDATTIAGHALLAGYDKHDGRAKTDVAAILAAYTTGNRQLGRFQLLGCADDAPAASDCARVLVGAIVSDSTGAVIDVFSDAIRFNKAATTTNKWNLAGNGKKLSFSVLPLAFAAKTADGTADTGLSPNPVIGLQIEVQAQTLDPAGVNPPTQLLTSAVVQLPGGFSIPFGYCNRSQLCVSSTAGATDVTPAGGVADVALLRPAIGWVGGADSTRAAKYTASYTVAGTAETRNAYLRADVLADPAAARFPAVDGLSTSQPLRALDLQGGTYVINWSAWATANPDLRLVGISRVFTPTAGGAPAVLDTPAPLPPRTTATLATAFAPSADVKSELWLQAMDSQGRRFHTRYTGQP
ncbi:carboxypeptidase-like regulatory domain-containing protein [Pelomonas cellulosilytica]|uniref:Carboxypeptidase-like regulatory domain-containing protein n=1 Tax=Pelomonas cellulosilytica TaxID=2906762 RepID=A0ABS8XVP7_9BURK|nr:carboxypeptidase-like regulatory domain-containing protein [Pelomonas sp. P8]MCE4554706.1 carboxypeptidase-like regulatory domain-containing protein [Pelomonas sp. P8]